MPRRGYQPVGCTHCAQKVVEDQMVAAVGLGCCAAIAAAAPVVAHIAVLAAHIAAADAARTAACACSDKAAVCSAP